MFNAPVFLKSVPDAAAIGAALRAKHGYLCAHGRDARCLSASPQSSPPDGDGADAAAVATSGGDRAYVPFSRVLAPAAAVVLDGGREAGQREGLRLAATPGDGAVAAYEGLAAR